MLGDFEVQLVFVFVFNLVCQKDKITQRLSNEHGVSLHKRVIEFLFPVDLYHGLQLEDNRGHCIDSHLQAHKYISFSITNIIH